MLKLGAQICIRTFVPNFVKSPIADATKIENLVSLNAQHVRKTSFFNKISKEQLWKGVLSVSNAGKKKGRGKRKDSIKKKTSAPLKTLGEGSIKISWPGLNTHVLRGNTVRAIEQLSGGKKSEANEVETKPLKSRYIHPLERGWSGRFAGGRKLGPPKPFHNYSFPGFESVILEHCSKGIITSIFGRRKIFSSIVATGNGNGLLGLGAVSKYDGKIALKVAQKKASKNLLVIDLIEKHTVNHDFCSEYGKTRVLVFKMPEGFGLKCHRVITEICKLVGIENLKAKVEGSCIVSNIIRAFVVGLLRQKTYQEIADEKNLHLVEFKEECHNFPLVKASPTKCLTLSEARKKNETFEEYIMGNKLLYKRDKKVPFYQKLPSWRIHLLRTLYRRNHKKVKIDLLVKYGACNSHLTEIYPECTNEQKKQTKEITAE